MSDADSAPLTILYRDERYIAVDKPAGMLVHRSRIAIEEQVVVLQRLRDQIGQRVYPVHRLDRPTSGVLIFGLDSEAASQLGQQFQEHRVSKHYHAVVRGYTEEAQTIDHPVKSESGKTRLDAVTHYRRLATVELPYPVGRYQSARYSLVQASPESGRMHQLRKHFKHIHHPIVGDTSYGHGPQNELFRQQFDCHRLLLFASALQFKHPFNDQTITIRAPLLTREQTLFQRLGWKEKIEADGTVQLVH